jgi:DNA polymerase-1
MRYEVASPEAFQLIHDGALVLARAEANGIRIDTNYLEKTISETEVQIAGLEKKLRSDKVFSAWQKHWGLKTNLASSEQLATVLFDVLGYPSPGFTERTAGEDYRGKRRYRTDEEALGKLAEQEDISFVREYIQLKKLEKARGTYLEGIRREVCDGFLHPSFNLNTVITYRSSSDSPNFQNIPTRRPEIAKLIRKCFIARKGNVLVETDFSGAEVRVAACYNKDPVLIKYITDPKSDMHRDTACQLFGLKPDQVDKKTTRDWAKNKFVFPQFYGSVYFQCAPSIWEVCSKDEFKLPGTEISVREHLRQQGIKKLGECDPKGEPLSGTFEYRVKQVEKSFWKERFKVYDRWKYDWYNTYRENGGFRTLTGFYIRGLFSRNDVINYPVQGSAFHCLLWSFIKLQKLLDKRGMKAKLVGQIHDSIIADVPENELQDYLWLVKTIITEKLPKAWRWIIVPIDVEAEVCPPGGSWYDKTQWIVTNGVWDQKA